MVICNLGSRVISKDGLGKGLAVFNAAMTVLTCQSQTAVLGSWLLIGYQTRLTMTVVTDSAASLNISTDFSSNKHVVAFLTI